MKFLLEKEFKQIIRSKLILPLIFLMPSIQLILLPFAATFEIQNIKLWVVDFDQSQSSFDLIEKIGSSGYFELIGKGNSFNEAMRKVEMGDVTIILQIPQSFSKQLLSQSTLPIWIGADAVNGSEAGIGVGYLAQIVRQYGNPDMRPMMEVMPHFRYNSKLNYKRYMVPGVLVMLVTLVCGILSALNIVSEKEIGTIEQINVTPIRKHYFILAKLIPFWVIGYIILTLGLLISYFLYGIACQGSLLLLYALTALYMVAFGGFGLLISTYAQTQQQAMFISFFFLMIFFLMAGIYTPISSMPHWAQYITALLPTVYYTEILRGIILKGSELSDLLPEVGAILLFSLIFNAWAIFNYKKTD